MDALSNLLQTTAAAASAILMGVCGVCLCVRLTRVMRGEESASGLENETVRALPDGRAMALAAAAKFVTLLVVLVRLVAPHVVPEAKLSVVTASFTWPQLLTAVIGGIIACLIAPTLRRALEKKNG